MWLHLGSLGAGACSRFALWAPLFCSHKPRLPELEPSKHVPSRLKKSETTEVTSPPSRGLSKTLKPEHLPVTFSKNPKAGMAPLSFCQSSLSQLTPEAGHN